ncbi:hypothetical protein LLG96_08535 [bacterium]|nr:hypothetical protein [bacterium]
MYERTKKEKHIISEEMLKTFWRLQIYKILQRKVLIDKIEVHEQSLDVKTISWEEYWKDTPAVFQKKVSELHKTWTIYIDNGFNPHFAYRYSDAYLLLISEVVKQHLPLTDSQRKFLVKVLGFENVILSFTNVVNAFAAITTSIRNPVFLSFIKRGLRKNSRNDPCLLPLIVAANNNVPMLFYHYRKQRLLKNTDENILFFLAADLNIREKSFHGLDIVARNLVPPWDSRIAQRSHLITDKVLLPIISPIQKKKNKKVLRILDIGSGDGQYTSTIVGRILKSGLLTSSKIELTMLDVLMVDPNIHFSHKTLLPGLARVEYIRNDYSEWLTNYTVRQCNQYDIVFLFRILHNFSHFKIISESIATDIDGSYRSRYKIYQYLSDYYHGLSLLFPEITEDRTDKGNKLYYPARVFNDSSLIIQQKYSLLECLNSISNGILIEDGDLTSDFLIKHLSENSCNMLQAYDLSHNLRLSINHVYWISQMTGAPWKRIWPA